MSDNELRDLPKISMVPAKQLQYELHFQKFGDTVGILIYPPGKPAFPVICGPVSNPEAAFAEYGAALE